MTRLTKQQQTVYDFIRDCMVARGYGPTVREIGLHMGIRSPNGVMCHLRALEKKGVIRRSANKSRAIELAEPLLRADLSLDVSGTTATGMVQLQCTPSSQLNLVSTFNTADQYLIQVKDEHLSAFSIKAGDHLLISKQGTPLAGQLVVAQFAETGANVIGQVQIEAGRLRVTPLVSPLPSSPESPFTLLGIVAGVLRLFAS
ncbi:MAG: repressor LexA [Pirellulales bacterium]